jgi:transglutaminase-like putative cysteine protease
MLYSKTMSNETSAIKPLFRCRRLGRYLTQPQLDEIRQIAAKVRRTIIASCARGRCYDATTALVATLRKVGYPATHVFGVFRATPIRRTEDWYEHHFALIGNLVVDITADQFNDALAVPFPEVYVGPMARGKSPGHHCWQTSDTYG